MIRTFFIDVYCQEEHKASFAVASKNIKEISDTARKLVPEATSITIDDCVSLISYTLR